LINEVKNNGKVYETKSFGLYWNRNARADGKRANALLSDTQKGPTKDDDILRISRHERYPADSAATHVFKRALSAARLFNRAFPRAGVWHSTDSTANEQFIRASACNDNEYRGLEKDALACHE
jgi:hypothetical protein